MRTAYTLSDSEFKSFRKIAPYQNEAWNFWKEVAEARGLDYTTIISEGRVFTALPLNHGKHWCFPSPLKAKKPPRYVF